MNPTLIRRALYLFAVVALVATGCAKKPVNTTPVPPVSTETKTPPTPPAPKPNDDGTRTPPPAPGKTAADLRTVYFALDSDQLSSEAQAILDANAQILQANKSLSLNVNGHCDERGTEEYNQSLSERRANRVVEYLTARGVAASQLKSNAYGKTVPADEGHDESAWAHNRRVEFK